MTAVVDASVVLEVVARTEAGLTLADRLLGGPAGFHGPHLVDVEVAQALRRLAASGRLDEARARQALADLADLPLHRYPHAPFLPRAWELRANATAYDATYLALAEALEVPLLTRDACLAAVPGHGARVEVV